MNAEFCPNKASKEFREMKDIFGEDTAYFLWMRNGGNHLEKAPNGADSKLFNTLLDYYEGNRVEALKAKAKTYKNEFIRWFGDWTGNYSPNIKSIKEVAQEAFDERGAYDLEINHLRELIEKNAQNITFEQAKLIYDAIRRIAVNDGKVPGTSSSDKTKIVREAFKDQLKEKTYFAVDTSEDLQFDLPSDEADAKIELYKLKKQHPELNLKLESFENIDKEYFDILDEFIQIVKPSEMFQSIYDLVDYTKNAVNKSINQYKEVSKVVDENGEPLVVWHGGAKSITIFKLPNPNSGLIDFTTLHNIEWADYEGYNITEEQRNKYNTEGYIENATKPVGVYFAKDRVVARSYFGARNEEDTGLYAVYLNIKKPNTSNKQGRQMIDDAGTVKDLQNAIDNGNDGVIVEDIRDYGPNDYERMNFDTGEFVDEATTDYIVFNPNQIKHVENLGMFNQNDPNIYHNLRDEDGNYENDLPFNKTQGSLIWLVRKAIKDGLSKSEIDFLVDDLNYENNSNIKVNWKTKEVFGDKLQGVDDINRTNDRNTRRIEEVVNYLNAKFGYRLTVEYVDEDTWLRDGRLYDGSNSCIINDVIYLRRSRMTTEIAAEEMLHTLIHGMKNGSGEFGNRQLFDKLFEQAKQQFPKLWNEIQRVYKYNHDEELVTQVLARYFNRDFDKRDTYKLEDLIEKFKNWFVKLFKNILEEFAGTYYANVSDINPLLDFQDISDMLLAKNLRFDIQTIPEIHKQSLSNKMSHILSEDQILHNISARQQAAEKEAQRLTVRMNILYREYEKIKSKTPSQERLANQIFETYNKLKQHMDISAVGIALEQARLTLGQYDRNLGGPAVMQKSNIYKYLYDMSKQDYQGITPDQLVDMYRNGIKFYKDLIEGIPSDRMIDLTEADKNNIRDIRDLIDNYIMPLWTEAIIKVGDDIVDAQVDQEVDASDQDKADMKEVAKDWLHKNIMYGDLNAVSNYVYNYSYSSNPIIKQAFHLIQHAEQKTLEEMHHIAPKLMRAYQAANKGIRSVTPGWQSMMMEYDLDGKPTGSFIRAINYGQYNKDLINFIKTLNETFVNDYGFTYVTDDTGATVNSLTGEYAEDEEWGPNGEMPKYVEYLRAIEKFKAPRVHRRFIGQYYLERLTRPYDGTIDPLSPEFKDSRFNHGLSPKTLKRYNYYQTNINYYYNKCQDPKTGLIYPERLNSDDRLALRNWEKAFDRFKDIFNTDGSYKSGEDLKMAYEVRAWQKWIGEQTNSTRFQDVFNAEANRIYQECLQTGNMRPYNIFLEHNASAGINPDYIDQTVGSLRSHHKETDESYRARILRKTLQDAVKQQLTYGRSLLDQTNNPLFWLHCKASDQAIDDARNPNDKGKSGWTPQQVEAYKKKFYNRELLYTDSAGNYIDENGNQVQPNTQQAKNLEEAGKLLTVRQWLINHYTDEALRNGFVQGLIDESTGNPIAFSGMTAADIKSQITNLLSYRKRTFEEDGSITEEYVPLTIFSMLWPKEETFFNKRTGKKENTIVLLGEGRFKESYSSLTDSQFNPNEGIAEKPDIAFENGRYDNADKYNEMRKDKDVAALYDLLIETMQNMQNIYSTNRKFNYKLPQINARMSALFSRIIKRGYSEKSLSAIWNAMTNIEANDDDMRTKEDYFVGVDGEVANNVPLKFIRNLKNPEDISTDLVSSVIMFADMAINYKNKTAIDATLKLLRYNMDEATRMTEKKKYMVFGRKLESNEYSKQMFDAMLDSHMYGNQWSGKNKTGGPSRAKIATFKTVDAFQSLESSAMLGLNFFSMSVGFGDALTRIFSESAAGKYMTPGDCLFALGKCLWYTPACIKNMFNPVANNKMTALMQMNGISKGIFSTYTKADWGKGRKFATNLLMGGWSMLDWMANALLMVAFYHNCRFYDGGEIPTGFYTKYEMQKAFAKVGKSKHYANLIHHNWSNYGNRVTLWDAYKFNGKGEVFVKPEFEQYVTQKIKTRIATKTKKRGALYNGMNPDNDVPQWKRDVIGRLVGALRGWIPQQFQHLFAGGTDNVVRTFEDVVNYEVTTSGTRKKVKSKKVKLTDEERSRRFAWDYETGTTQDQIVVGLYRSIGTLWRNIKQWAHLRPGTAKLSEVEKYAMKDAVIFMAMLSLMMIGWTYVHDWAREIPKPKDRYEAGPMSAFNPVDYYNYIRDVYIPNEYWRLAIDDVYFRIIEAKISNINPQQVLDIVNAATALKSGLDDQLGLLGLGIDFINGDEDIDKINKQGAYKFYTQGERNFYRGIGFLKNIHTFLTYEGATNNLRWYTNKFGKFYRMAGYDFKAKDKEKPNSTGFSGGDFSGGDFVGGDFSGGNFSGGNFE